MLAVRVDPNGLMLRSTMNTRNDEPNMTESEYSRMGHFSHCICHAMSDFVLFSPFCARHDASNRA